MRRTSVPAVCRAACHAAQTLLHHSKELLTPQQVLVEIETLAKDLDVQGPSFPYDSACSFLVLCMRVASQDVRLYRMQLEEKVLAWLMDTWRPGNMIKSRMSPHTMEDILSVLASICCISRDAQVLCHMNLPDCPIVTSMIDEDYCAVIRDYLLHATLPLPPNTQGRPDTRTSPNTSPSSPPADAAEGGRELVQPRGRERRISAFLLKSLEDLIQHWELSGGGRPSAEKARTFLDLAAVSLLFEGTLARNGTRSNRRVQQAACKLVSSVLPQAADARWTASERTLIIGVLEPLVLAEQPGNQFNRWQTLLPAGPGSGIRQRHPDEPGVNQVVLSSHVSARRDLQRFIFQSPDVSNAELYSTV